MSFAAGGLGIISFRPMFPNLLAILFAKSDIKSILFFLLICIIFFVLAYLTNPSEASFRAFLTEESFRQHLSRLEETVDDDCAHPHSESFYSGSYSAPSRRPTCHFANSASVSLRTPKYVLRGFAIFTMAAIVPLACATSSLERRERPALVSDSWYIGAFGKWWRGGIIEAWYQDIIAKYADEESWRSGILTIRSLRKPEYTGLPYSNCGVTHSPPPSTSHSCDAVVLQKPRNSSPPPLPRSVSLPLHAAHLDSSSPPIEPVTRSVVQSFSHASFPPSMASSSPSATFEQSPRISQILTHIVATQSSVHELHAQLAEHQSSSARSHTMLQKEIDLLRQRKRNEDASKVVLKSRMKLLDDSKRAAESTKRDAEKRLKAAQLALDYVSQRMTHLEGEIARVRKELIEDDALFHNVEGEESVTEAGLTLVNSVEGKHREIKVAEEVITSLNIRTAQLEGKLASSKDKLRELRECSELKGTTAAQITPWRNGDSCLHFNGFLSQSTSNLSEQNQLPHLRAGPHPLGHHSVLEEDRALLALADEPASFSPLTDSAAQRPGSIVYDCQVPITPGLLPSGLMTSLDSMLPLSRAFQPQQDEVIDRDRLLGDKNRIQINGTFDHSLISAHPISSCGIPPPLDNDANQRDLFDVRWQGSGENFVELQYSAPHVQHSRIGNSSSLDHDFLSTSPSTTEQPMHAESHWSHTLSESSKCGNPDSKVFSVLRILPRRSSISNDNGRPGVYDHVNTPGYDALNPNGFSKMLFAEPASGSSSLLRAFAPSPEEREALQRALGGSANTSLERLPSLSDVGSMPSSPTHGAASTVPHHTLRSQHNELDKLPSWIQALPCIKKPNFSPWEEDESAMSSRVTESNLSGHSELPSSQLS